MFSLFLHILYLCVLLSIVSMKHDWCCCVWRRSWQATKNCLHKKVFFAKHKKMNSIQKNVFQQKKNWTVPPSCYLLSISTKNSVCWINVLKCRGKSFSTKLPCFNLLFENSKKNMENKLTRQRTFSHSFWRKSQVCVIFRSLTSKFVTRKEKK